MSFNKLIVIIIVNLYLDESLSHGYFPFYGLFTFRGVGRPEVKPPTCGFPIRKCDPYSIFKRLDGSCTNPVSPTLGMAGDTYISILPPKYEDGRRSPTATVKGKPLPLVRNVKTQLFPDGAAESRDGNLLFVAFGQIMAHDISRILETRKIERCCSESSTYQSHMHRSCYPINIPDKDIMYTMENIQCLNFTRAQTDMDLGCKSGFWAKQINSVTASLDMSVLYGSSHEVNHKLRTKCDGQLKTVIRNGVTLPPLKPSDIRNCQFSFELGDDRSNQNAALMAMHILVLKQHNRIATNLAEHNPHWGDERIFDEARRILIAQFQYISYYEWLPLVISKDVLSNVGITYTNSQSHVNDFDPRTNISPSNEYAHSAFVYFHSIVPEFFMFRHSNGTTTPFDWANNIFCQDILTIQGSLESLYRGMVTQPMAAADKRFAESVAQRFDRNGNDMFGTDLRSIDIQRGRDTGVGSYADYKEICGDGPVTTFEGFGDNISKEDIDKLRQIYSTPDAVELSVGGALEAHAPGSKVGPTFECLLTDQFVRSRVGDYLWFEHSSSGFSVEQLSSIKDSSISSMMCNNADGVRRIQPSGFVPPNDRNAVTDCSNIPDTDFSMWREAA